MLARHAELTESCYAPRVRRLQGTAAPVACPSQPGTLKRQFRLEARRESSSISLSRQACLRVLQLRMAPRLTRTHRRCCRWGCCPRGQGFPAAFASLTALSVYLLTPRVRGHALLATIKYADELLQVGTYDFGAFRHWNLTAAAGDSPYHVQGIELLRFRVSACLCAERYRCSVAPS